MKAATRILLLSSLVWGMSLPVAHGQDAPASGETVVMSEVLFADPEPHPIFVPPVIDPNSVTASAVQSLGITINYNPTGTGRCEVAVVPWPNGARTALEYAVRIWA